jgi:hypothetical protein
MTESQREDVLEQLQALEHSNRFWKRLALGFGTGLVLLLLLGGGLGVALVLQLRTDRHLAMEAMQREIQARHEAAAARDAEIQQRRLAEDRFLAAQKAVDRKVPGKAP